MHRCATCGKDVKLVPHVTTGNVMILELNPPSWLKPNITLSLSRYDGLVAAVVGCEEAERARAAGGTIAVAHQATCTRPKPRRKRGRRS